ncbi:MAG TPA: asparagine synthase C-terminal domain-containing protein, partial [Caulobacteraceae bacterium]
WLDPLARRYASRGALGPSVRRAGRWLRAGTREELFESTMAIWPQPSALLGGLGCERPARADTPAFDNVVEPMLWRDTLGYLPGDILCKVDRAAMANGLETRVPLLDLDVVALAWRARPSMKVNGGQTKVLLRRLLARYVPPELTERPKVGFTVPLHEWLTGGLRDWARDLLDPRRIRRQGVLDVRPVEAAWRQLNAGDSGVGARIWAVLMFQSWMAARGR